MEHQKNYNIFALRGDKTVNDMDVCEQFNIDPSYAFTPKMNDLIINKMRQDNIIGYMEQGMSEKAAKDLADARAADTRAEIMQHLHRR